VGFFCGLKIKQFKACKQSPKISQSSALFGSKNYPRQLVTRHVHRARRPMSSGLLPARAFLAVWSEMAFGTALGCRWRLGWPIDTLDLSVWGAELAIDSDPRLATVVEYFSR